jgi:TrmH family RNA methyltransferase
LGTIFALPLAVERSTVVRDWLRERRIAVFAARVDGASDYHQADFNQPAAIVLGSEAHGLSAVWSGNDVSTVRLPMRGAADSLNLSATAAVLLYEACRQRTLAPCASEAQ